MKKILVIITAVFFAAMLALTFSARPIHNSKLPHVSVQRVQEAYFPYEYTAEDGETLTHRRQNLAVTKEQYERGVYVLYSAEKNGEQRDFVRLAEIIAGTEYDGCVDVVSGLAHNDRIVVSSDREMQDGEVVLID